MLKMRVTPGVASAAYPLAMTVAPETWVGVTVAFTLADSVAAAAAAALLLLLQQNHRSF